jgi:hypothetical protein
MTRNLQTLTTWRDDGRVDIAPDGSGVLGRGVLDVRQMLTVGDDTATSDVPDALHALTWPSPS